MKSRTGWIRTRGGRIVWKMTTLSPAPSELDEQVGSADWSAVEDRLRERPYATLPWRLSSETCAGLAALWDDPGAFRSHVDMARHRFGVGEYRYFAHPLPSLVDALRRRLYGPLAAIANRWTESLGGRERFPAAFEAFEARCAEAGQRRPTPLLLRYEAGGYNCLHQDVYGAVAFPMQVVLFLSRPGLDFDGGEFLLVQQRPRAQSVAEVVPGAQGEMVVFANRHWPAPGRARLPSHERTARREPGARRDALRAGHHLPRRGLTGPEEARTRSAPLRGPGACPTGGRPRDPPSPDPPS